jgi:dihydrofolate reductase
MMLALIWAAAENDVIGREGDLPWHLPKDLKRFKALTLDHTILMGRKTFESIGRPLPRRRSIVISRNPDYRAPGAEVVSSLASGLALARQDGADAECFVIGGAEILRAALPLATKIYLTRVHAEVAGNVLFPFDPSQWQLKTEEHHPADSRHPYSFTFQLFTRFSTDGAEIRQGDEPT